MSTITAASTSGTITSNALTAAASFADQFDVSRNKGAGSSQIVDLSDTADIVRAGRFGARGGGADTAQIIRAFYAFDVSSITGTVSSVVLKLKGSTSGYASNTTCSFIIIKASKPSTSSNLVASDFDAIPGFTDDASMSGNVTDYSSEVTSLTNTTDYTEITLNSTARSDVQSLSDFIIAVVDHDRDYSRSTTGLSSAGTIFSHNFDGVPDTKPPQIVVTEAATGYTHNVLGVAAANIAKVNGVATANIDKINGVD
jgi:hypothetical protein